MNRPHPLAEGEDRMPDHSSVWLVPEDDDLLRRDIEHQVFEKAPFYRELLRAIEETEARKVLEVGAGSTIDSCWLAEHSDADFHALDSAATSACLARRVGRLFPRPVRFHLGDAFEAPFNDESFDVVFHQGLLEHFPDPVALLRENLRILRKGGILVVDVPQRYSLYTILKRRRMRKGEWPWGWEREYSAGEMRALAEGMPMEIERLSSWGYDFYTSILRRPWEKFRRRNPLRDTAFFQRCDSIHRKSLGLVWEWPWQWIERCYGPHFMMNVTGVYRRTG